MLTDQTEDNDLQQDQDLDLRGELMKAMSEAESAAEAGVDKPQEKQPTDKQTAGRERDETGKFKSKEADAGTDIAKAAPDATQAPAPQHRAPQSWSAAAREKWADLPPDIQAEIARREEEVHKGFTRLDNDRQFGSQMREAVLPYMAEIQAAGATPQSTVQEMLQAAYVLRRGTPEEKNNLLRTIAQHYNIDLNTVAASQDFVDPHVHQLQQQMQEMRQRLHYYGSQYQQQETANVQSDLQAFASDPANRHFEAVRHHMAALMQSGAARDLKDAYDQAVWANPDTRSILMADQSRQAEEKRVAEQKQRIDQARKAGGSVSGAPAARASAASANPNRSLREDLEAAFDDAFGTL